MCCASLPAAARHARQNDMLRRRSFLGEKRRCRSTKPQERATVLMNHRSSRENAFCTPGERGHHLLQYYCYYYYDENSANLCKLHD